MDFYEVDIRAVWCTLAPELFSGEGGDDRQLARLAVEYECRVNPVWAMPELAETLKVLHARVLMGVVSNAQFCSPLILEEAMGCRLEETGHRANHCAWFYREGRAKPSARLLGRLLARLAARGIEPGSVAVVGNDMTKAIAPARAHGCRIILFAGDRRSLRMPASARSPPVDQPDAIVTHLSQVRGLLNGY